MAVMHSKMMSIVRGDKDAKSKGYEISTRATESTRYPDSEDEWSKSEVDSTNGEEETSKPRGDSAFTNVSEGEVSLGGWWQQEEEQEGMQKMTSTLTEYDMSGVATVRELRRRSLGDWWQEDEQSQATRSRAITVPSKVHLLDTSDEQQDEAKNEEAEDQKTVEGPPRRRRSFTLATTGPSKVLLAETSDAVQPKAKNDEVEAAAVEVVSDVQDTNREVLASEWQKAAEQELLERQSKLYHTEFWNQVTSMVFCTSLS